MKSITNVSFLLIFLFRISVAQTVTEHIHIDQFGYLPNADKVAVISDPINGYNGASSYVPGSSLSIVDEGSGLIVFTAITVSWGAGATHTQSGDKGWWFDFTSLTDPGEYHVLDVTNNTKSHSFTINEDVYYDVLKAASKMFYYNRCNSTKEIPYAELKWIDGDNFNNALQDSFCRYVYDPSNPGLERDLSGGWFDAGDYNKYVTFAAKPVHDLLYAYQESTDIFGDNWNIPESNNGIPDLLDEINWELEWLEKMTNSDGSVIIKMGSIAYNENDDSPPSANVDQRYYGPTCTSASIAAAGMYAHSALVYESIPALSAYAATLENKAIDCFGYALTFLNNNTLEVACDDGTIKAGDADWGVSDQRKKAILAAVYLWELTGSSTYGDYIINNINDVDFVANNWLGNGSNTELEALLHYSTLPGASTVVIDEVNNSILPHITGDWNNFFGANDIDLYRTYIPDWAYHWGSSLTKSDFAILNRIIKNYDVNTSQNDSYDEKAAQHLHYFHGINPQNIVYLSNMYDYGAENCANEIYHTWFADGTEYDNALTSSKGPAPGFVTGGANKDYTITTISPPYGQPIQKSYLDFNTSSPENSWEITEPAIYYQATYLRLLAAYTNDICSGRSIAYVDAGATGNSSGESWSDAFLSIDDAIGSECFEAFDTIFIAEGTYVPNTSDRAFSYAFDHDMAIVGGYASGGSEYDPDLYEVVLSGNINDPTIASDNLYHCLTISAPDFSMYLKNLTFTGGYANGIGSEALGGGLFIDGDVFLENISVYQNAALNDSEGIFINPDNLVQMKDNCLVFDNIKL